MVVSSSLQAPAGGSVAVARGTVEVEVDVMHSLSFQVLTPPLDAGIRIAVKEHFIFHDYISRRAVSKRNPVTVVVARFVLGDDIASAHRALHDDSTVV